MTEQVVAEESAVWALGTSSPSLSVATIDFSPIWIESNLQPKSLFALYLLAKRGFAFEHVWVGESQPHVQYERGKRYLHDLRKEGFDIGQAVLHQGYGSSTHSPHDGMEFKEFVAQDNPERTKEAIDRDYRASLETYLKNVKQPTLFMLKPPRELVELFWQSDFDVGSLKHATLYLAGNSNLRLIIETFHQTFVRRFREFHRMDDEDFAEIKETVRETAYRTLCRRFELFGKVYFVEAFQSIQDKVHTNLSACYPEGWNLYQAMQPIVEKSDYLQAMMAHSKLWNQYLFQLCSQEVKAHFVEKKHQQSISLADLLEKSVITSEELEKSYDQRWTLDHPHHLKPFLATYKLYAELNQKHCFEFQFFFDDILLAIVTGDEHYTRFLQPAYLYLTPEGFTSLENKTRGDKDKQPILLYYNLDYKQLIHDLRHWLVGDVPSPTTPSP